MDLLPIVNNRSCGECTKCCEGHLRGDIELSDGRKSWIGQEDDGKLHPCGFLNQGVGCGAYEERPLIPCKAFKCDWLTNPDMPESFKPSNSNAIFSTRTVNGHTYTKIIEAGRKLDSEVLSWAIQYYLSRGENFSWRVLDNIFWLGNEEFNNMMDKDYPLLSETNADGQNSH
jgi:hypothetical protein